MTIASILMAIVAAGILTFNLMRVPRTTARQEGVRYHLGNDGRYQIVDRGWRYYRDAAVVFIILAVPMAGLAFLVAQNPYAFMP